MSNIDFTRDGSIKVDGVSAETELAALQMVEAGIRRTGVSARIDVIEADGGVVISWTREKG